MKKDNAELRDQLILTKEELLEMTELLTIQGVFAVKVKFTQERDEFLKKLLEAEGAQAISIKILAGRLAEV